MDHAVRGGSHPLRVASARNMSMFWIMAVACSASVRELTFASKGVRHRTSLEINSI